MDLIDLNLAICKLFGIEVKDLKRVTIMLRQDDFPLIRATYVRWSDTNELVRVLGKCNLVFEADDKKDQS